MGEFGAGTPSMNWAAADLPQAFGKFKKLCQLMFAGPLKKKSEEEKVAYLQIWSGEEGIEIVSTWNLTSAEEKHIDTFWTRWEQYVAPKSNFRLARFKFRTLKQESSESIDSFIRRARILAGECRYENVQEQLIDCLIFGCCHEHIQSKLLESDHELNLDRALDIARTLEATRTQLNDIRNPVSAVHAFKHKPSPRVSKPKYQPPANSPHSKDNGKKTCRNCGLLHDFSSKNNCPAYGTKCRGCGKPNHWKNMCRATQGSTGKTDPSKQRIHGSQEASHGASPNAHDSADSPQLYYNTLKIGTLSEDQNESFLFVAMQTDNATKKVRCQADSGADGNVMSAETFYANFPNHSITPSSTRVMGIGGINVTHIGKCLIKLTHEDRATTQPFHIVSLPSNTLLGRPTLRALNLITYNFQLREGKTATSADAIIGKYKDCFKGIGAFPGEYKIILDPEVQPVIHPPRRVPEALRTPLKRELDSLVEQNILAKTEEPTDWVNSLVCVTKKNGDIRICLDPKDLNKAIRRPHYVTPTIDDVLSKLNGANHFTLIDARCGYWNIKLDQQSAMYTTFNTPFGRYRFLRLPFGLVCAQDVFQRMVDQTFGDLPGVTGIADDIIVFGHKEDHSDHDENLQRVMERAKQTGIRFNPDKCRVGQTEIPFFGYIISETGIKSDPEKVRAIEKMDPSGSLKDLQTFLGMVQFISRFLPNLASSAAVLWDLTKSTSEFQWGPEHQQAVNNIKTQITKTTTLRYYDSKKPVTIQVDASQRGLGATLLQENGPVEFRSKLLTETESRYSNIEREMLAVVFGLEKFHYYAFGRKVTIESDHKPLEAIMKKSIANAPPRIARMMLRVTKYDAEVKYVPGRDVPVADALSRLNPCEGKEIAEMDITVHELHLQLNASQEKIRKIQQEGEKDEEIILLKKIIYEGWPHTRAECPPRLLPYWNYRDELSVADAVVLKGSRIVIPRSLQAEVLQQIHLAHQGAEKCKLRAKGSVFWPNINSEIEDMVRSCDPCQRHQNANIKEPMISHDVPQRAWHTIGSDLFLWNATWYLLIADYYSKFPIVRKLSSLQSATTIAHMKSVFEEFGIPEKLITAHDTQFTSNEFQKFANTYGFTHSKTSPYYSQANGFIERHVQTVKRLFQKCKESNTDPHMAMLILRSTPLDHNLPSPAELLNSRVYKSNIPAWRSDASVAHTSTGEINTKLQSRQDQQKAYYDRSAHPLPELQPGNNIRVYNPHSKTWEPGSVKSLGTGPRSYIAETDTGSVLPRNRIHLRPSTPQPVAPENEATLTPPPNNDIRRSVRNIKPPHRLDL